MIEKKDIATPKDAHAVYPISPFYQFGEVKAFIRLLQDGNVGVIPQASSDPPRCSEGTATVDGEPFLTLPVLHSFVEGGEAFLAERERSAVLHEESCRDATLKADASRAEQKAMSVGEASRLGGVQRPPDSWDEKLLLELLKGVFDRAPGNEECGVGFGRGGGLRGHLDSFDVDGDGVLNPQEFAASLHSLGAKAKRFNGRRCVDDLVSRFRRDCHDEFKEGSDDGVSIAKIAQWFSDTSEGREHGSHGFRSTDGDCREKERLSGEVRARELVPGEALRRAVRLAESKGTTLERAFARLDESGNGFITLRQLLRGLDQLGVFKEVREIVAEHGWIVLIFLEPNRFVMVFVLRASALGAYRTPWFNSQPCKALSRVSAFYSLLYLSRGELVLEARRIERVE